MTAMQWFLIILLVLLIAAGIFLLTRRPSSGSESAGTVGSTATRDELTDHDTRGPAEVFDQEAENRHDAPPAATQEVSYTDTASGAEVPLDEDVRHRDVHEGDNDPGGHGAPQAFAAGSDDAPEHAASYHSDTGHPGAGSQADTDATYAPGEVGADSPGPEPLTDEPATAAPGAEQTDQGHPGAHSQPTHDDAAAVTYGEPEPVVDDTTYAQTRETDQGTWDDAAVVHDEPVHDEHDHDHDHDHDQPGHEQHEHDETVHDQPVHVEPVREGDNDAAGDTPAGSYAPGSATAPPTDAAEHTDTGHPGPSSQAGTEATYAPGEVGADSPGPEPAVGDAPAGSTIADDSDQGHPGPSSQPGTDATYAPTADDVVADSEHREEPSSYSAGAAAAGTAGTAATGAGAAQTAWADDSHDDVPDDAGSAGFADTRADEHADDTVYAPVTDETEHPVVDAEAGQATGTEDGSATPVTDEVVESPYGPGSAMPSEDGAGPEGWQVKGNSGSMLFHTPDSPGYDNTRAEVWFESEEAARNAGFAHWDRKRR